MLIVISRSGFADHAGASDSDEATVRPIKAQQLTHMLKLNFMVAIIFYWQLANMVHC